MPRARGRQCQRGRATTRDATGCPQSVEAARMGLSPPSSFAWRTRLRGIERREVGLVEQHAESENERRRLNRQRRRALQERRTLVIENDPLWYKDAILYEVHVRTFHDDL